MTPGFWTFMGVLGLVAVVRLVAVIHMTRALDKRFGELGKDI